MNCANKKNNIKALKEIFLMQTPEKAETELLRKAENIANEYLNDNLFFAVPKVIGAEELILLLRNRIYNLYVDKKVHTLSKNDYVEYQKRCFKDEAWATTVCGLRSNCPCKEAGEIVLVLVCHVVRAAIAALPKNVTDYCKMGNKMEDLFVLGVDLLFELFYEHKTVNVKYLSCNMLHQYQTSPEFYVGGVKISGYQVRAEGSPKFQNIEEYQQSLIDKDDCLGNTINSVAFKQEIEREKKVTYKQALSVLRNSLLLKEMQKYDIKDANQKNSRSRRYSEKLSRNDYKKITKMCGLKRSHVKYVFGVFLRIYFGDGVNFLGRV